MTVRPARPHALYVAWGFPPSRSSGVHRALATANGLVEAGFDVTVLTCARETYFRYTRADETLEERIDPAIEVVRIPFDWPAMDRDIRRWDRRRAWDPRGWRGWRSERDRDRYPELTYGPWAEPLIEAARAIHARRTVDVTVATANPNVDIEAAHQLFLDYGVPYVADQRDAWLLDVFTGDVRDDPAAGEREAAYVADAHECWYVNEPIRAWHEDRYGHGDRMHVVANGFDAELAPEPRLESPPQERPLTFAYLGTVTSMLPMEELVAGWRVARTSDPSIAAATAEVWGYFGFFSGRDTRLAALLEQGEPDGVCYRGPVARAEVRDRYRGFDVLLFVVGAGRYVTSGKVFEYMASGLPIVSVHDSEVEACRVLEGYPLWFPAATLAPDDVAAALQSAGRAARSATLEQRRACVEYAERFDRANQLRPRLSALRLLVESRREFG